MGQRFGKCMVIVLMVESTPDGGTLEYASWGDTRARCTEAKDIADAAYEAIMGNED